MRILIQTGAERPRGQRAGAATAVALLLAGAANASADEAAVQCTITENGTPSRGTVVVEREGKRLASGTCGRELSVPAGPCTLTVRLDGALDNPAKTVQVTAKSGATTAVPVDFATATLEVRVEAKDARGTGLVAVEQNGKRLGTLGSGVGARLSAGTYVVVVRMGGKEQRYEVALRPGQRRLVRAQF